MLVPLTAIVTTSLPMVAAIAFCAKDRKTDHAKNKNLSSKSGKSTKSARGKTSKSGKSSRSHRSKRSSKSGKKGKSSKSAKGGKSGKSSKSRKPSKPKKGVMGTATTTSASTASGVSEKSEKSEKSAKSSSRKNSKSSKSGKTRRLDSDAQKKMEKSGKSLKISAACGAAPGGKQQTTAGSQTAKSLVEEVNAIKHSNQLSVVPAKLQYQTLGGVSQIELKNTSGERKAYKVKCSDNQLYRVNPVYGFAEPHSSVKIDVLRMNGEQKTDKLVLLTANAKDSTDPHEAFTKQQDHREMMVVPLIAS